VIRRAIPPLVAAGLALPIPARIEETPLPPQKPPITRASTEASAAPPPREAEPPTDKKRLGTIVHGHTLERLPITEDEPSIEHFSSFLADRAFEQETRMDPKLVELLRALARTHEGARFEILSGYRSPKRNESMRKKGRHVASHSQHTLGGAIDFRIEGISTAELAGEILQMKWGGGLGTYAGRRDRFVHVDTGPKRRWSGF
jgi:uncharacterized protein YcbK (DUF882 family)